MLSHASKSINKLLFSSYIIYLFFWSSLVSYSLHIIEQVLTVPSIISCNKSPFSTPYNITWPLPWPEASTIKNYTIQHLHYWVIPLSPYELNIKENLEEYKTILHPLYDNYNNNHYLKITFIFSSHSRSNTFCIFKNICKFVLLLKCFNIQIWWGLLQLELARVLHCKCIQYDYTYCTINQQMWWLLILVI